MSVTNRSKNIGTWTETAVTKAVQPFFPGAERRVLHGSLDQGDIKLSDQLIIEVKGGQQTRVISDVQVDLWLDELYAEIKNSGAVGGLLVVRRWGKGDPLEWWAYTRIASADGLSVLPIRMLLCDGMEFLGYPGSEDD